MNWQNRRERFRAQLNGDTCIHPGSVFDPISARIAEQIGFEAGMFAGSVASLTVLGDPDHIEGGTGYLLIGYRKHGLIFDIHPDTELVLDIRKW